MLQRFDNPRVRAGEDFIGLVLPRDCFARAHGDGGHRLQVLLRSTSRESGFGTVHDVVTGFAPRHRVGDGGFLELLKCLLTAPAERRAFSHSSSDVG